MRLGDLCRWLGSLRRPVPALDTTVPAEPAADGVPVYIHWCDLARVDYQTPGPIERCVVCSEVGYACKLNARGVVAVARG